MVSKFKHIFHFFGPKKVKTKDIVVGEEQEGTVKVPIYNIPQLSDERWDELAAENKRYWNTMRGEG